MSDRAPLAPAVVLGVGLGGFVDGIVLHQVLQWHHLLTDQGDHPADTVRGLEANTLADGLFHAFAWVAVVVGVVLLWRGARRGRVPRGRTLAGGLAIGWGAFNLVEGIINHHLLTLHRVRDDVANPLPWDLGFLALGLVLVVGGWLAVRADRAAPVARRGPDQGAVSPAASSHAETAST